VINRGKLVDVRWNGKTDPRGLTLYQVGTVGIKHLLYSRIGADADKPAEARLVHVSDDLPPEFFAGLVSETYNPSRNRFEKRSGTRNEPLDTWVYAYAATHHPQLRLHRLSRAEWDQRHHRLVSAVQGHRTSSPDPAPAVNPAPQPRAPDTARPAKASTPAFKRRW
jgi:phage terminase large subunit GpA-like protein